MLFDWQILIASSLIFLSNFHSNWPIISEFSVLLCVSGINFQQFPFSFLDSLEISDLWLLWQGTLSIMNPFNILADIFMKISFGVSTSVCWDGKNIWDEVCCIEIITVGFQWPNLALVSEHSCHLGTSLLPKYTCWLSYYCHYRKFTYHLHLRSFRHEDKATLTHQKFGKEVLSTLSSTAKWNKYKKGPGDILFIPSISNNCDRPDSCQVPQHNRKQFRLILELSEFQYRYWLGIVNVDGWWNKDVNSFWNCLSLKYVCSLWGKRVKRQIHFQLLKRNIQNTAFSLRISYSPCNYLCSFLFVSIHDWPSFLSDLSCASWHKGDVEKLNSIGQMSLWMSSLPFLHLTITLLMTWSSYTTSLPLQSIWKDWSNWNLTGLSNFTWEIHLV